MNGAEHNIHKKRDESDFRSPGPEATPIPSSVPDQDVEMTAAASEGKIVANIYNDLEMEAAADNRVDGDVNMEINQTPQKKQPDDSAAHALASFVAQTDANGVASTPRSAAGTRAHGAGVTSPAPCASTISEERQATTTTTTTTRHQDDGFLDTIKSMCCCFMVDDVEGISPSDADQILTKQTNDTLVVCDSNNHDQMEEHENNGTKAMCNQDAEQAVPQAAMERVKLLAPIHPDDKGKKCLVLDLDETLVHSSFRAVPGADFVIPVQIEDVVHFVYVAKRPGVDKFLVEMAKYYEIVIYTASLNKYADPLLDLLDPNRVIRARLFRESCVFYEGNYVKDLSLLDRDLAHSIIVDNSPSSYIFHPENAIDCSSFIDDPMDNELDQIGNFLKGVKDVKDVRHVCRFW
eukprot:CAMPEP_0196819028 /NCGR_PEP_ID=MMETSP1362-20130617/68652_1 /TAXON_ID=163516 /ORGANISM="Leptocylindrus danicus, Strain CCMP1856" /LENGTH=405 /DNA_ID=CAMNT_0042197363 /DNA_START=171 /DNA_END=1385 /DNA_ORIENTATION=+